MAALDEWPQPPDPFPTGSIVDVFFRTPASRSGWYRATVTSTHIQHYKTVCPKRYITVEYDADGTVCNHYLHNSSVRMSVQDVPFVAGGLGELPFETIGAVHAGCAEEDTCCETGESILEHAIATRHRVDMLAFAGYANDVVHDLPDLCAIVDGASFYDVDDWAPTMRNVIVFAVGTSAYTLDWNQAKTWYCPKNEREYNNSHQRALWRTAQEMKMEDYLAGNKWEYITAKEAQDNGWKILRSLWARDIKELDGKAKLAPRGCVVGTGMDTDMFPSHHDVMRISSCGIIAAIRTLPHTFDAQIDCKDAFQNTYVDGRDPGAEVRKYPVIFEQLPGHAVPGPGGAMRGNQRLVCKSNVAWQGGRDSGRLYGRRMTRIYKDAGFRQLTWDPCCYVLHNGPLAGTDAALSDILNACAKQPATADAPHGWILIGMHVDDGMAVASNRAMVDYTVGLIQKVYSCNYTSWRRILGYTYEVRPCIDGTSTVTVTVPDVLEQIEERFLEQHLRITPKHVTTSEIDKLQHEEQPSPGTPEHAAYKAMQAESRSMLGLSLWLEGAYPQLIQPTNTACEFMAEPTRAVNKHMRYQLMHLVHNPVGNTYGGHGATSLELTPNGGIFPFSALHSEPGLHMFSDAALGQRKAITGFVAMLAHCLIAWACQRQQLKVMDIHSGEVVAFSTACNMGLPIRGMTHELGIPQIQPTPIYVDSQTTIYVARDQTAVKRSIWILRRIGVMREASERGELDPRKVAGGDNGDNVADMFTKYLAVAQWRRLLTYVNNSGPLVPYQNNKRPTDDARPARVAVSWTPSATAAADIVEATDADTDAPADVAE